MGRFWMGRFVAESDFVYAGVSKTYQKTQPGVGGRFADPRFLGRFLGRFFFYIPPVNTGIET